MTKIVEKKNKLVEFSFKIDGLPAHQKSLTLKLNNLINTSEDKSFVSQIKGHFFSNSRELFFKLYNHI